MRKSRQGVNSTVVGIGYQAPSYCCCFLQSHHKGCFCDAVVVDEVCQRGGGPLCGRGDARKRGQAA